MRTGRIAVAIVIGLLFTLTVSAHAEVFKIATQAPDGTAWMNEMRAGAKEIETRTEGRVSFKFYPGGTMGDNASVLRKIRYGQLHGGAFTAGGLANVYPDFQIYTLPFLFKDYGEVDHVRKQTDQTLIAALEEKGFVAFGLAEGGFAYLFSDRPVTDAADLKGKKVWVPENDTISIAAFTAAGVSPIPLPLTDVLTGLQTGLIDTVGITAVGAIALQWFTKVKYMTDTPLIYTYGTIALDRKAFSKLTPEDQATVREVLGGVISRLDAQARTDEQGAREALVKQGIEIVALPTGSWEKWRTISEEAIAQLAGKGIYSDEMLAVIRTQIDDYRRGAESR